MPHAWDLVEAHPSLFQIDRDEWNPASFVPCSVVQDSNQIITVARTTVGGHPVTADTFAFILRRIGGVVHLRAVVGNYLPISTPDLTDAMDPCPDLNQAAAQATVLTTALPFTTFQLCQWSGFGSYDVAGDDTIAFETEATWNWYDDPPNQQVMLVKHWSGRVIVNPNNYAPELMSSDAYCPDSTDGDDMGFRLSFDAVTGELLSSEPGLECIVC
jgi:hypothetical protein